MKPEAPLPLPLPATVNRRSFLRASAAVAGTLVALDPARFAHGAGADDTLKVALVGCGGRGSGAADQALKTGGSTRLVAMADAFQNRLDGSHEILKKNHPEKVDVKDDMKFLGFEGYKQAIAAADVVILATPPGFRPIHFEEAVRQGKHVFMEKPVAVDAPGVRRVLAAAEEAKKKNLKVGVGLQRHHQQVYLQTLEKIWGGALGDIVAMRVYWNDAGVWVHPREKVAERLGRQPTEMEFQMTNWYYFTWLSGDHICEQHIHNLDVGNWVKQGRPFDPAGTADIVHPVKAWGMGGRQVRTAKEYGEIFDHHAVQFEYADGSRMISECRHIRNAWSSVSEHVHGTKGTSNVGAGIITGENAWRHRADKPRDAYQQEHDDLFAAIRGNKPFNEAFFGAISSMISVMGRMATYSGVEVEWDKAINSEIDLMPERFAWDAQPRSLPGPDGFYPIPMPGQFQAV